MPTKASISKRVIEASNKVSKARMELRTCQQRSCKKELAASDKFSASIRKRVTDLDINKVGREAFLQQSQAIREDLLKSEQKRGLFLCAAKQCKEKMIADFQAMLSTYKMMCEDNNLGCDVYEKGRILLASSKKSGSKLDVDKLLKHMNMMVYP
jgi:hypothetical protein